MSFTNIVKNEISKNRYMEIEVLALLSSVVRNSERDLSHIRITTENASVARMLFTCFKDVYGVVAKITVRKGYNYHKNFIYLLDIYHKLDVILRDLSIYDDVFLDVPKDYLIDDENLIRAYITGLFMISGSINDPKKSRYHLEFIVDSDSYAEFLVRLLNEKFYLNSKYIKRDNRYMIYMKEAEKIGDFLRIIQANQAVLYYEDIRIYRDHKNMTNRLNNCEQANVDKMIMSAMHQVSDIELIMQEGGLELLDEKEQVVAIYRLKYKDVSLLELSQIISMETGKEITKSGVHHRMKKISDLASRIRSKGKQ